MLGARGQEGLAQRHVRVVDRFLKSAGPHRRHTRRAVPLPQVGAVELLVDCLDGADREHFALHAGEAGATLRSLLDAARPLASTVIPQTPVAWTALLAAAPPPETHVWGWYAVEPQRGLRAHDHRSLPATVYDWGRHRVVLAGLPFLPDADGPWGTSIAGLVGPTKKAGGSRPSGVDGRDPAALALRWSAHQAAWAERIAAAANATRADVVLAHCDAVDWFAHRFGPRSEPAGGGWRLAGDLLDALVDRLAPRSVLVLSDHGVADVRGFVLIHDVLRDAGLAGRDPRDLSSTAEVPFGRVFCASDYGALWCEDAVAAEQAHGVLLAAGAHSVVELPGGTPGDPALAPDFGDGWVALVPPELYPREPSGPRLEAGPDFDRLRALNWRGDHARVGLVGGSDPALAAAVETGGLTSVKPAILQRLAGGAG